MFFLFKKANIMVWLYACLFLAHYSFLFMDKLICKNDKITNENMYHNGLELDKSRTRVSYKNIYT